jgi:hypothetical protein
MSRSLILMAGLALGCAAILAVVLSSGEAAVAKTMLVNVSEGELPADTGTDKTTTTIDEFKELGGKALKVSFEKNDSFGGRLKDGNKEWKRHRLFRFDAFNPGKEVVVLNLNVVHASTTDFQTRVLIPIKLQPGRNEVKIGIGEMKNQNGSAADLANVLRWYIADADSVGPTVYFSDIWLEGASP